MTGIVMFLAALFMLAIGFSVAFTFGAIAVIFGLIGGMVESFGGLRYLKRPLTSCLTAFTR